MNRDQLEQQLVAGVMGRLPKTLTCAFLQGIRGWVVREAA